MSMKSPIGLFMRTKAKIIAVTTWRWVSVKCKNLTVNKSATSARAKLIKLEGVRIFFKIIKEETLRLAKLLTTIGLVRLPPTIQDRWTVWPPLRFSMIGNKISLIALMRMFLNTLPSQERKVLFLRPNLHRWIDRTAKLTQDLTLKDHVSVALAVLQSNPKSDLGEVCFNLRSHSQLLNSSNQLWLNLKTIERKFWI